MGGHAIEHFAQDIPQQFIVEDVLLQATEPIYIYTYHLNGPFSLPFHLLLYSSGKCGAVFRYGVTCIFIYIYCAVMVCKIFIYIYHKMHCIYIPSLEIVPLHSQGDI